ncbi:hypothetical protein EVG20_g4720 [Dentipellis fragilis]|uniref:Peptidase A1 domain-containing protein n=1 Tax=Dentipellis fragilis TaxID=205917 RepID=A0A4Y9YX77_9AGAM|nr:hypothetical protein EVG20_g4720 [Dentipellis fragilis]
MQLSSSFGALLSSVLLAVSTPSAVNAFPTGVRDAGLMLLGPETHNLTARAPAPIRLALKPVLADNYEQGYTASINIGTKAAAFNVLVDSGSSELWVISEDSQDLDGRNSIGEKSSTSFKETTDPFTSTYEDDSSLTGFVATDNVKVGGQTLPTFRFGVASTLQGKVAEQAIDGIMGFAKSTASHVKGPTVLEALAAAKLIPAAISGWSITRHAEGDTGEILLGAVNTQLFDDAHKVTMKNVVTAQSGDGLFRVTISSVSVGGAAVAGIANRAGAVDVGTSAIFVPQADLLAIRNHFPGAVPVEGGAAFAIPCNNQQGISLTIGGTAWPIDPPARPRCDSDARGGKQHVPVCYCRRRDRDGVGYRYSVLQECVPLTRRHERCGHDCAVGRWSRCVDGYGVMDLNTTYFVKAAIVKMRRSMAYQYVYTTDLNHPAMERPPLRHRRHKCAVTRRSAKISANGNPSSAPAPGPDNLPESEVSQADPQMSSASATRPVPGPGQVLVKVHAAALNPVDYWIEDLGVIVADFPAVAGSDGAGTIEVIAEDVTNWKKGDRVFFPGAFFSADRGNLSFDEASTIPLGISTAAGGMYQEMRPKWPGGAQLFPPWEQAGRGKYHDQPIAVIGGSSSVGQFALQLAKLSGFNPIITTASKANEEYCKQAGATHVIDYHVTPYSALPAAVTEITPKPIRFVYDAISLEESQKASWEILSSGGTVTVTLYPKIGKEGEAVEGKRVAYVHANVNEEFNHNIGNALYANLTKWLEEGVIRPNKIEVVEGGLGGVSSHLERLKKGQVSGLKLVVHPQETP